MLLYLNIFCDCNVGCRPTAISKTDSLSDSLSVLQSIPETHISISQLRGGGKILTTAEGNITVLFIGLGNSSPVSMNTIYCTAAIIKNMSEQVLSQGDWIKHLHVQVAKWEKKGEHTQSPSTYGCTCKDSSIDCIKKCMTKRLYECKCHNLVSKYYIDEVHAFLEFQHIGKFDLTRFQKLQKSRKCILSILYCSASYGSLTDLDRQHTIGKFEQQNTKNILEGVQTLTALLRSTPNIYSVSRESFTKADSTFNDTDWLKEMYILCIKISNGLNIQDRVIWKYVTNGVDPNNGKGLTKQELNSELRSLVPRWLQPFSCPRPYREEVQLLLAFLEGGVLDKKKIQWEQKLRKIAIGLNDVLLTVLKIGNDLNEIIKTIEPSRRSQLITCLTDIGHRLEALSQNTDGLQTFSGDEHTSNQSNHDCDTGRRKEPLVDAKGYADEENAADPVTEKMMNVSNPKAASNGSKEAMLDSGKNSEPTCSHVKAHDLTVPDDRESNDSLLLPSGLLSDSAPTRHCLDLEQEITHHPLISEDILDQRSYQLIDAAKAIVAMPFHGDFLDIVNSQEHQLSGDSLCGQEDITVSNPESEDYRRMADLKQSTPTQTSAQNTSYAASDLTFENVSQPPSDFTEVDPSNEDVVFYLWCVLGDAVSNTTDNTKLWKVREKIQGLNIVTGKRLKETALQSEVEPERKRKRSDGDD